MELPILLTAAYKFRLHLDLAELDPKVLPSGKKRYFLKCWEIKASPTGKMLIEEKVDTSEANDEHYIVQVDPDGKSHQEWCFDQNQQELKRATNSLNHWKEEVRKMPSAEVAQQSVNYFENVVAQFLQWFHGLDTKLSAAAQVIDATRPYLIEKFKRICEDLKLVKGETVQIQTKYEIAKALELGDLPPLAGFLSTHPAYRMVSEYASRLGYVRRAAARH